ncbi:MAG: hypothetical protein K8T91_14460 [Planctomycetes bacterium]|nr:hypothetical protein [Planctomycetota bacterium]
MCSGDRPQPDRSAIQQVTIRLDHCLADVSPGVEHIVVPLLTYESLAFAARAGQLQFASRRKQLCGADAYGRIAFPRGLLSRVSNALSQAGYTIQFEHLRSFDHEAFAVNDACEGEFRFRCAELIAAVRDNPCGLIETPPGQIRSSYIGVICRLFHHARVIVPCATRDQIDQMSGHLPAYLGGEVDAVSRRNWSSSARVVVCGFDSFDSITWPPDFQIIVFPDAEQTIGELSIKARGQYIRHRVYGFVSPGQVRSDRTTLRLEALAGPVIYRSPRSGDVPLPVQVVMVDRPLVPCAAPKDHLPRRQRLIWHNQSRNEFLAGIAAAIAGGDIQKLWAHGLFLDRDQLPIGHHCPLRVVVLVDSPGHGRQLRDLLPQWPLIDAVPQYAGASPASACSPWGPPPAAIITAVAAAKMSHLSADVVVWASGGERALLPEHFPCKTPSGNSDVLLVDVADDCNAITARWTRQRLVDYQSRGFQILASPRRLCGPQEAR